MRQRCINRALSTEVVVGAFMLTILLGLGYFTIILSREAWFRTQVPLDVLFDDVMGLRDGDIVICRGMPVGKVRSLTLSPDGVLVHSMLDEELDLREDYKITVVPSSLLGGRQLQIDKGSESAAPIPADAELAGFRPHDLIADAGELFNGLKEGLVDGGVIDDLRAVSADLKAMTADLRGIASRLAAGEGTLGKLLSEDATLYNDLAASVASLKEISGRLENGEGTLGKLMSADDTLYKDVAATMGALRATVERVESGRGTLGRLLSEDDQLYKDLSESVASLKTVAQRIEKGDGMLGRMTKDDGLYEEIEGAVHDMRLAIDDFRETAPVTTFTSIFFGAL